MNKRIIFTIFKKEFFAFLNSPLSFVITVPFLLLSIFIFMRSSLVVGEASLRPYFELLPWFLLILTPALSMKLLTDEKKNGTLELLFAHPISELDIVLGKFLGALGFYLFILLATLLLPITLLVFANPDPGILLSQYLGIILVGAMYLSLGILASSYVNNSVGSFLLSASLGFVLILLGLDIVTLMVPWPLSRIVTEIALLPHTQTIARGALDLRDISYFLTLISLFLSLTVLRLSERKVKEDKRQKQKLFLAMFLILGIGASLNIFLSFYPLRIDLTQQKLFSLSQGTKQTISKLPDLVTVTLYASRNLPAQVQITRKEIEDLLKDYQNLSGKVAVSVVYPDQDPVIAAQAKQAGIEEVTFNRIGTGSFEVQTGFLGLTIRYGDKTETLPFIQDSSDLEYQLTRRIRKLTQAKEKNIGIYINGTQSYNFLQEIIRTEYQVTSLTPDDLADAGKLSDKDSLLIIDDGSDVGTDSASLKRYLENGGKVLFLSSGVSVSPQTLTVSKSFSTIGGFLSDYGITVKNDLIYDLRLNETLTFGGGNVRYIAPYPFWLRALPAKEDFPSLAGIKSVTLAWPSSIEISQKEGVETTVLLQTSPNAGKQESTFTISPQTVNTLADPLGKQIPLAAEAKKGNSKIVVVANSIFAGDQFMENNAENSAFIVNTVDYLVSDADIAAIPRKVEGRAVFKFRQPYELIIFQYGNILVPPILVTAFALFWLSRRKKLTKRIYTYAK